LKKRLKIVEHYRKAFLKNLKDFPIQIHQKYKTKEITLERNNYYLIILMSLKMKRMNSNITV